MIIGKSGSCTVSNGSYYLRKAALTISFVNCSESSPMLTKLIPSASVI